MTDKLWSECSKEEHREVANWERRFRYLISKYRNGEINAKDFQAKLDKLGIELNKIEAKYD